MSANGNDLRHVYAEVIGETIEVAVAVTATSLATALEPGRYILRVMAYGGGTALWVNQGEFGVLTATTAAAPNTQFLASTNEVVLNAPLITFIVHGGNVNNPSTTNGLSLIAVGGTGATVHLTKVSRGRN